MYLKRLEIQGFKSFANKTTLEFEKGITSVVGPNGSGKSNIADAIRWVLGEQSLKQLRGKKSEDVIFAGSEKKSRMSFAEVSVTFDNADRRIPVDYSEVSITRRMDRSGESDYLINDNKVRLLDIIDLVLKSNIGTSRYTVIGQGTIDQMILAGPVATKDLIDEASGVKTYYLRREKTLKRLEQTTQNLIRVQDLIAEIEPRLKSLRRQAKRMQERAVIEQELKTYQAQFYAGKYWHVQDALIDLDAKILVLSEQNKELERQIEQHRAVLDKSEQNNRSEVSEYHQIQTEIKKLSDRKNKIVEDTALIRGKLQAEKSIGGGDAKSLDIEKNALLSTKSNLNAEIESAAKKKAEIEKQLAHQQKLLAEINAKLTEIQKHLDNPKEVNFSELSQDIEVLTANFDEFYQTLSNASDLREAVGYADKFRSSLNDFKKRAVKFAQNPFADFENQRQALQNILLQKDGISEQLNRLDLEKSKISISHEYLEKELVKTEQKLLQVDLDLKQISSSNADEYFNQLIKDEQKLNAEVLQIASEINELEEKINKYHANEQTRKHELLDEERMYRSKQDQLSKLKDQQSELQVQHAVLETQKQNISAEAQYALGVEKLAEITAQKNISAVHGLEEKIHKIKNQLDMIGGIDELTIKEYEETEARYTYLNSQVQDLNKGMDDLRTVIDELDGYIKKQFNDAYARIDEKFQNYFRILFNGGRAYLSVLKPTKENSAEAAEQQDQNESEDQDQKAVRPEEKMLAKYEQNNADIIGIDIKATPPGKKLATISALSGGERALTSIALLCALLTCFPSPFVVLDEVDAALDEANTIRFAQILASIADGTQFITVTHNRETMRQAHTLYGVTMGDDSISKILSIKIEQAQAYAK